jgi:hypothetical protein
VSRFASSNVGQEPAWNFQSSCKIFSIVYGNAPAITGQKS